MEDCTRNHHAKSMAKLEFLAVRMDMRLDDLMLFVHVMLETCSIVQCSVVQTGRGLRLQRVVNGRKRDGATVAGILVRFYIEIRSAWSR